MLKYEIYNCETSISPTH